MAKLEPDDKLIRKLAALLDETGLIEIEYEADGQRIRVGRAAAGAPASLAPPSIPGTPVGPTADDATPPGAIVSPMVGTVYVAAEPGGVPLIKVGDEVKEGQTLLIIEAMKVMNPLTSPRVGKVIRIFVSDGQPVEFGEPLVIVE